MEWINVKDRLPAHLQDVYIKTDCDDCPIVAATHYTRGLFIPAAVMQCDKHYETDQKFNFLKACPTEELLEYTDRITLWMAK